MLALTLLIAAANPQDMKRYNAKRQLEGWRFHCGITQRGNTG
jgi:hypothetical protein